MSLWKTVILGISILFMFSGSSAIAQENLTCKDIEWVSAVTDKYPNIADACTDVVMKDGKLMAKIRVEIMGVRSGNVSFRFIHPDGTRSETYQTSSGPDWVVILDGRRVRQRDLSRGQQLNLYMPSDRWAVIYEDVDGPNLADAMEIVEEPEPVFEPEPETVAEPEPAPILPATASQLPLIGLLGAGFLALGAVFRYFRRRVR